MPSEGEAPTECKVEVVNKLGLHARASARLAREAGMFSSQISVCKDGICATATSIMGLMMLGAARGDTVIISVKGDDQDKAIEAVKALIANRFGENE